MKLLNKLQEKDVKKGLENENYFFKYSSHGLSLSLFMFLFLMMLVCSLNFALTVCFVCSVFIECLCIVLSTTVVLVSFCSIFNVIVFFMNFLVHSGNFTESHAQELKASTIKVQIHLIRVLKILSWSLIYALKGVFKLFR